MKCNCRIVVTVYNLKTHHHVRSSPDIQMASFDPENRHQLQTCVSMSILFSVLSPLYLNLISFPSPPKKKNSRSFLTQILSQCHNKYKLRMLSKVFYKNVHSKMNKNSLIAHFILLPSTATCFGCHLQPSSGAIKTDRKEYI